MCSCVISFSPLQRSAPCHCSRYTGVTNAEATCAVGCILSWCAGRLCWLQLLSRNIHRLSILDPAHVRLKAESSPGISGCVHTIAVQCRHMTPAAHACAAMLDKALRNALRGSSRRCCTQGGCQSWTSIRARRLPSADERHVAAITLFLPCATPSTCRHSNNSPIAQIKMKPHSHHQITNCTCFAWCRNCCFSRAASAAQHSAAPPSPRAGRAAPGGRGRQWQRAGAHTRAASA